MLIQNKSFLNINCQTETGAETRFANSKTNSFFLKSDLMTPNPIEKTIHSNFFKSKCHKSSKLVYQKKFLISKKVTNQSMCSLNLNDLEGIQDLTGAR